MTDKKRPVLKDAKFKGMDTITKVTKMMGGKKKNDAMAMLFSAGLTVWRKGGELIATGLDGGNITMKMDESQRAQIEKFMSVYPVSITTALTVLIATGCRSYLNSLK